MDDDVTYLSSEHKVPRQNWWVKESTGSCLGAWPSGPSSLQYISPMSSINSLTRFVLYREPLSSREGSRLFYSDKGQNHNWVGHYHSAPDRYGSVSPTISSLHTVYQTHSSRLSNVSRHVSSHGIKKRKTVLSDDLTSWLTQPPRSDEPQGKQSKHGHCSIFAFRWLRESMYTSARRTQSIALKISRTIYSSSSSFSTSKTQLLFG